MTALWSGCCPARHQANFPHPKERVKGAASYEVKGHTLEDLQIPCKSDWHFGFPCSYTSLLCSNRISSTALALPALVAAAWQDSQHLALYSPSVLASTDSPPKYAI